MNVVPGNNQPPPGQLASAPVMPVQYELPAPDERTPLVEGGVVAGVFVNAALAAQSRRFLERFRSRS